jgi:deoxyribonucleoside regulator
MYYKEKLTQSEISSHVGLSRSQVSRMLQEAEDLGIARIEVVDIRSRNDELEKSLVDKLGLAEARVVYVLSPAESVIRKNLARYAAQFIVEMVNEGDIIGVTSGQTLGETARFLRNEHQLRISIVQLMGGLNYFSVQSNPDMVVRDFTEALRGNLCTLHAPLIVENNEVRRVIMSTTSVSNTVKMWGKLSSIVMGIGSPSKDNYLVQNKWFTVTDMADIIKAHAVGVICGQFYDICGDAVRSKADDRLIAAPLPLFRKVKRTVAIAGGNSKISAIIGAIHGGYCNTLITDNYTAEHLLGAANNLNSGRSKLKV